MPDVHIQDDNDAKLMSFHKEDHGFLNKEGRNLNQRRSPTLYWSLD